MATAVAPIMARAVFGQVLRTLLVGFLLSAGTPTFAQSLDYLNMDSDTEATMTPVSQIEKQLPPLLPGFTPDNDMLHKTEKAGSGASEQQRMTPAEALQNLGNNGAFESMPKTTPAPNGQPGFQSAENRAQMAPQQQTSIAPQQTQQAQQMQPIKPMVYYQPVGAIAVFPVVQHGTEKAFGDLPIIFATEFANRLDEQTTGTRVLNPMSIEDEIEVRGLGSIYRKAMDRYQRSGRPDRQSLRYLLKRLSADGRPIERVVFVDAVLDINNPAQPYGLKDRFLALATDELPKNMKYKVRSQIRVFDTTNPMLPEIWTQSWYKTVKAKDFYNVTHSLYMDSDSMRTLSKVSRQMTSEMMVVVPNHVHMTEVTDVSTGVQARIHNPQLSSGNTIKSRAGNLWRMPKMSDVDRRRILQLLNPTEY